MSRPRQGFVHLRRRAALEIPAVTPLRCSTRPRGDAYRASFFMARACWYWERTGRLARFWVVKIARAAARNHALAGTFAAQYHERFGAAAVLSLRNPAAFIPSRRPPAEVATIMWTLGIRPSTGTGIRAHREPATVFFPPHRQPEASSTFGANQLERRPARHRGQRPICRRLREPRSNPVAHSRPALFSRSSASSRGAKRISAPPPPPPPPIADYAQPVVPVSVVPLAGSFAIEWQGNVVGCRGQLFDLAREHDRLRGGPRWNKPRVHHEYPLFGTRTAADAAEEHLVASGLENRAREGATFAARSRRDDQQMRS